MTTLPFDRASLHTYAAPVHGAAEYARAETAAAPGTTPRPAQPALTEQEVELRADWAGAKSVVWITLGVAAVCFVLAVALYGWELAGLCTIGLTLYSLIFGAPFWLAVVDAAVQSERSKLTGGGAGH